MGAVASGLHEEPPQWSDVDIAMVHLPGRSSPPKEPVG